MNVLAARPSRSIVATVAFSVLMLWGQQTAGADALDDFVRQQMSKGQFPGAAVVVLNAGKVREQRPYGLANVEARLPTTLASVYPLASVTKVFTATAIFMLVEEGKLRLYDKISVVLPNLPGTWGEITVLHCLSHTSGLPDLSDANGSPIAATQEEALAKVAALPMEFVPGATSSYNQTGFLVLKMIIERTSGVSFQDFLSTRIFAPLKMTSVRFGDSQEIIPNRVELYHRWVRGADGRRVVSPNHLSRDSSSYPPYWFGGVGLNMSAADFLKFDMALSAGRLLRPGTLQQMWAPFELNDGTMGSFAAGWETSVLNGRRVVSMVGAGRVCYARLVDGGASVIWMQNGRGGTDVFAYATGVLALSVPELAKAK